MLRFRWFQKSRPHQLPHTNLAKNGLPMPLSQLYAWWCLNYMRKHLVIQLLFVSEFMAVWSKAARHKLNLQTFATYGYVTLPAQKMHRRPFHRGGTVTPSAQCLRGLRTPAARGHHTSGHQVPALQRIAVALSHFCLWHPEWLTLGMKEEERRPYLHASIRRNQDWHSKGSLYAK